MSLGVRLSRHVSSGENQSKFASFSLYINIYFKPPHLPLGAFSLQCLHILGVNFAQVISLQRYEAMTNFSRSPQISFLDDSNYTQI